MKLPNRSLPSVTRTRFADLRMPVQERVGYLAKPPAVAATKPRVAVRPAKPVRPRKPQVAAANKPSARAQARNAGGGAGRFAHLDGLTLPQHDARPADGGSAKAVAKSWDRAMKKAQSWP